MICTHVFKLQSQLRCAYLKQECQHLIVLEQHSIIHNHGQGPGHFVVQPQRQQLCHIAPAGAAAAAVAGSSNADGRVVVQQLHCSDSGPHVGVITDASLMCDGRYQLITTVLSRFLTALLLSYICLAFGDGG